MRRFFPCLLLLTWLLAACGGGGREFVWRRMDTQVEVQADGSLGVTETLTLAYTGGPFTFVIRDLPERRLDALTNISVSDGERAYQQVDDEESEQPYTFSVTRDDGAQRVRWVYPETTDGERTFVLRYDVAGAVRRGAEADEVWWTIVFGDRDEVVERASGRILLPAPVPVAELDAAAPDVPGEIALAPGQAEVAAGPVPPGDELTLRLSFPRGVVGGGAPQWQVAQAEQEAYNATARPTVNLILSIVTAALAILLGALLWGWWRRNGDPAGRGVAGGELLARPDDLSPALAAKLAGGGDGQALLGTLFDLARRGHLVFSEQPGTGGAQLAIARAGRPADDLAPYEAAAVEALPAGGDMVALQGNAALAAAAPKVGGLAQEALVADGLLDPERLARRRAGLVIGALLAAFGGIGLLPALVLAERYSWWLPALAGAVLALGVAWLIVAASVRGLTQAGSDALARWRAFQRYLERLAPEAAPGGQFELLLPYAVALGAAVGMTRAYAATAEPLPAWYYPLIVGDGGSGSGAGGVGSSSLLLQDFSQGFIGSLGSAGGAFSSSGGGVSAGGASGGGGGSAG